MHFRQDFAEYRTQKVMKEIVFYFKNQQPRRSDKAKHNIYFQLFLHKALIDFFILK